ncbi:MAG: redoxin domain-containing protein [Fuerstiella sp.]|nr:redoxin domain-containing protein [Fuerstiella sp.]
MMIISFSLRRFCRGFELFVFVLTSCVICVCSLMAWANEGPALDSAAETSASPEDPFPSALHVPDGILEGGTTWLNTSVPITMKNLRGKVVLFDFWTYCCINCMHVLPDLKYLEEKYPGELVVIGVHSAKFDNEKDSEAIRHAIMRYGIVHPVVNDSEMLIWRKFGVRAWPTLALIDPQGRYLGSRSGEGNRELFDDVIGRVIEYHRAIGKLNENPVVFDLESGRAAATPLKYPGKVLADAESGRLFISDTSHNRIVVADLDGQVQEVIGSGRPGSSDGQFTEAEFDHPQGLCLVGTTLYVADTENHLLRTIDFKTRTVSTLAGTGEQGRPQDSTTTLRETPLNSPWSVCHVDGTLYIAMAGPHQIWFHQLGTSDIGVFAGNAREDVINGPLKESSFAQPSGLAVNHDQTAFFVVDSEGSSIRKVPLAGDGRVTTIAGTSELPQGRSLFAFGDVDGNGDSARFQHPIGVARRGNLLYVADSYNHKIRTVDAKTGDVLTWLGDGTAGDPGSTTRLNEPAGLSVANDTLYVADTNSHRICAVDLDSRAMRVLPLSGLTPPHPVSPRKPLDLSHATQITEQSVQRGKEVTVRVKLAIPDGGHLNELAPVSWEAENISGQILDFRHGASGTAAVEDSLAQFSLPVAASATAGELGIRVSCGYCQKDDSLCRLATSTWRFSVRADADSQTVIKLNMITNREKPDE